MYQKETKENIRKEYFKSLGATLISKLNAKHVFRAINVWVRPAIIVVVIIIYLFTVDKNFLHSFRQS